MVDRVLLAENEIDLLEAYKLNLLKSNFEVIDVFDGSMILDELKRYDKNYFKVIISDTDMISMDGPESIRIALEENLLDLNKTLVIGISDCSDNQEYWRGLANFACFYDKCRINSDRLGAIVSQCLRNFRQGGLWRERMPMIL